MGAKERAPRPTAACPTSLSSAEPPPSLSAPMNMSALQRLPQEALAIICDFLLPPDRGEDYGYTYTGLTTLLALASTSRLFHEHALNTVWNTLPCYSLLIYTLPRDAWTTKVTQPDHTWSSPITELVRRLRRVLHTFSPNPRISCSQSFVPSSKQISLASSTMPGASSISCGRWTAPTCPNERGPTKPFLASLKPWLTCSDGRRGVQCCPICSRCA